MAGFVRVVAVLAAAAAVSACSVFGIRTTEQPAYRVVAAEGALEIRRYPPLIYAETVVAGDYDTASDRAFRRLADYIFAERDGGGESIGMTAPVFVQPQRSGNPASGGLLAEPLDDGWRMRFVMPGDYTRAALPEPEDPAVELVEVPAQLVGTVRFSGFLGPERARPHARELMEWLEARGYQPVSAPRLAGYDPPWTLPVLRRNEVHVDLAPR